MGNRMKKMGSMPGSAKFIFLFLATMLVLIGCGDSVLESVSDDDSFDAQMEEARIALDAGDYEKAVARLEQLHADHPENQIVQQYLSNAYAGLGGLDTYEFLSTIDALDDSGLSGSIDMVGKVIGDANGSLTEAEVFDKLDCLDQAIGILEELVGATGVANTQSVQAPDEDLVVQRGLLGLSRIVLIMAELIIEQLGLEEVIMTEEGVQRMYQNTSPDFEGIFDEAMEEDMAADIAGIDSATDAIRELAGENNDLYEDFEQFMNDLDTDGNRRIDQMELESYLQRIIQS